MKSEDLTLDCKAAKFSSLIVDLSILHLTKWGNKHNLMPYQTKCIYTLSIFVKTLTIFVWLIDTNHTCVVWFLILAWLKGKLWSQFLWFDHGFMKKMMEVGCEHNTKQKYTFYQVKYYLPLFEIILFFFPLMFLPFQASNLINFALHGGPWSSWQLPSKIAWYDIIICTCSILVDLVIVLFSSPKIM